MPQQWNPFQYGPNGTDLARWEWIDPPGKPSRKHLVDQRGRLLAHVTWEKNHQGIVGWRTTARDEAARWIGSEVLDPTAERELDTLWATPEDAMEQAEIDISHAAFAVGAVPSPSEVPAIFMLGHIVTGDVMLREIEKTPAHALRALLPTGNHHPLSERRRRPTNARQPSAPGKSHGRCVQHGQRRMAVRMHQPSGRDAV